EGGKLLIDHLFLLPQPLFLARDDGLSPLLLLLGDRTQPNRLVLSLPDDRCRLGIGIRAQLGRGDLGHRDRIDARALPQLTPQGEACADGDQAEDDRQNEYHLHHPYILRPAIPLWRMNTPDHPAVPRRSPAPAY